jgi:hypothetical protein
MDVIKKRNPNTDADVKKSLTKRYADEGKKRRAENPKVKDPETMLKTGKRMETPTTKQTPTKAGTYPSYAKESNMAKDFKDAFASARKSGKKEFSWNGRKYNTKVK